MDRNNSGGGRAVGQRDNEPRRAIFEVRTAIVKKLRVARNNAIDKRRFPSNVKFETHSFHISRESVRERLARVSRIKLPLFGPRSAPVKLRDQVSLQQFLLSTFLRPMTSLCF